MDEQNTTWHDVAEQYRDFIHEKYILEPALRRIFRESSLYGQRVADVGCGTGRYSRILAEEYQCEVRGSDVSSEMIAIARSESLLPIDFSVSDAREIPLEDASMDAVLMSTLLPNIRNEQDMGAIFQEAFRILKPSGKLIVTTPHPCFEHLSFPGRRERILPEGYAYLSDGIPYRLKLYREDGNCVEVTNYHWILETQVENLLSAGFFLSNILEPKPEGGSLTGEESSSPVYMIILASKRV